MDKNSDAEEEKVNNKNDDRVDKLIKILRNGWLTAPIVVVGIFLISFGKVTDAVDHSLRELGLIHSYDVNLDTERGRFSSELIRNAWNRLFWTRTYNDRHLHNAPTEEQDKAWNKYIDALETWNSNLMNYYIGLDKYYKGSNKRDTLKVIQQKLRLVAALMDTLRNNYPHFNALRLDSVSFRINRCIDDTINPVLYKMVDQPENIRAHKKNQKSGSKSKLDSLDPE